jgi:hypothetical protein
MNMPHTEKQVRRKSHWRSKNCGRAARFAKMRAAKERKRMERVYHEEVMPDVRKMPYSRPRPLFVVTIKCRDGETARCDVFDGPFGVTPSASIVARKIACIIRNYRPIKT